MPFNFNKAIFVGGESLGDRKRIRTYEASVRRLLTSIHKSTSGKTLLDLIEANGRHVLIRPYASEEKGCGATASYVPGGNVWVQGIDLLIQEVSEFLTGNSSHTDHTEKGKTVRDNHGRALKDWEGNVLLGTGVGTSSTVSYSPRMWDSGTTCGKPGAPGASPQEILFHELVHSYRHTAGKSHSIKTTGGATDYHNLEEFLAVVATNVFTSDPTTLLTARVLRGNHKRGFQPLVPAQVTSGGFMSIPENLKLMKTLKSGDQKFVDAFKGIRASFNPFSAV